MRIHYRFRKVQLLGPILSKLNTHHTTYNLFKSHFNIISYLRLGPKSGLFPSHFSTEILNPFLMFPCVLHALWAYPSWFDQPNSVWWRLQFVPHFKLLFRHLREGVLCLKPIFWRRRSWWWKIKVEWLHVVSKIRNIERYYYCCCFVKASALSDISPYLFVYLFYCKISSCATSGTSGTFMKRI
jgi:hypothetical protein